MCSLRRGLSIREATAADNEALLELERSSPLDLTDAELVLDRSPDYFACLSLQEDARVMVAEEGGRLVGVCWASRAFSSTSKRGGRGPSSSGGASAVC
jgi:hypothetical protein